MAFLPSKKERLVQLSGLVHSLYYIYKISIKPISLNCQIELHQPNKNPHRSNASLTSLTQSLYNIYKNTLNLFLNFCFSYQDRAEHSSKPINKHQQKWLKLFLLEGKKSSWIHHLFPSDKLIFLLLIIQYFQSICYLFVIYTSVILIILLILN